jgi:TRAP-type mannitol/chloroaromatic compound transport system permease small subunit
MPLRTKAIPLEHASGTTSATAGDCVAAATANAIAQIAIAFLMGRGMSEVLDWVNMSDPNRAAGLQP